MTRRDARLGPSMVRLYARLWGAIAGTMQVPYDLGTSRRSRLATTAPPVVAVQNPMSGGPQNSQWTSMCASGVTAGDEGGASFVQTKAAGHGGVLQAHTGGARLWWCWPLLWVWLWRQRGVKPRPQLLRQAPMIQNSTTTVAVLPQTKASMHGPCEDAPHASLRICQLTGHT